MEKSYFEIIAKRYAGKIIDVYLGDTKHISLYAEKEHYECGYYRGVIVGVDGPCLFIKAFYYDGKEKVKIEREIALQEWNVKSIMPVDSEDDVINVTRMFY